MQEILATAFDQFCADTGYEEALPVIKGWLSDENPNACRAVTKGLDIWISRYFFKTHPETAIDLISRHRAHESQYLRTSVGNALREISKKFLDLVEKETTSWDLSDKNVSFTYKLTTKGRRNS